MHLSPDVEYTNKNPTGSLFYLISVSQSGRNRPLGGDFNWQSGEKNKGPNRGAKQHKGGENALPLIDD